MGGDKVFGRALGALIDCINAILDLHLAFGKLERGLQRLRAGLWLWLSCVQRLIATLLAGYGSILDRKSFSFLG